MIRIKLDIDGSYGRRKKMEIAKRFVMLKRFIGIEKYRVIERRSPSGRGWHVIIDIKPRLPLDEKDIVFIQLLLLSDWKRELFNWFRVKHRQPYWNVLFKEKGLL